MTCHHRLEEEEEDTGDKEEKASSSIVTAPIMIRRVGTKGYFLEYGGDEVVSPTQFLHHQVRNIHHHHHHHR